MKKFVAVLGLALSTTLGLTACDTPVEVKHDAVSPLTESTAGNSLGSIPVTVNDGWTSTNRTGIAIGNVPSKAQKTTSEAKKTKDKGKTETNAVEVEESENAKGKTSTRKETYSYSTTTKPKEGKTQTKTGVRKSGNSEAKPVIPENHGIALSEPNPSVTTGKTEVSTSENLPSSKAEKTEPATELEDGQIDRSEILPAVSVEKNPVITNPDTGVSTPTCSKTSVTYDGMGTLGYLTCGKGQYRFDEWVAYLSHAPVGEVFCDDLLKYDLQGCLVGQGSGWRFTPLSEIKGGDSND